MRVDIASQADFEYFGSDIVLNQSGWKANNTIFVENGSLENELIIEKDNTYLKAYTSNNAILEFDIFATGAFTGNDII